MHAQAAVPLFYSEEGWQTSPKRNGLCVDSSVKGNIQTFCIGCE